MKPWEFLRLIAQKNASFSNWLTYRIHDSFYEHYGDWTICITTDDKDHAKKRLMGLLVISRRDQPLLSRAIGRMKVDLCYRVVGRDVTMRPVYVAWEEEPSQIEMTKFLLTF